MRTPKSTSTGRLQRCAAALILAAVALLVGNGCQTAGSIPTAGASAAADGMLPPFCPAAGDILLTRAPDVIAAMLARHGSAPGLYSHAALYVQDDTGVPSVVHMQTRGLVSEAPAAFFRRYALIAQVRCQAPASARAALGQMALQHLATGERPRFALGGAPGDGQTDQFNCFGLINQIHREAGLPAPFVLPVARAADTWTAFSSRALGLNTCTAATANSVLTTAEFAVVATWSNPAADQRVLMVHDALVDTFHDYVAAGMAPAPPPWGSRLVIGMAAATGLASEHDRQRLAWRAAATGFAGAVETPILRELASRPDWTPEAAVLQGLVRDRCDRLRPRFFSAPPATAAGKPGETIPDDAVQRSLAQAQDWFRDSLASPSTAGVRATVRQYTKPRDFVQAAAALLPGLSARANGVVDLESRVILLDLSQGDSAASRGVLLHEAAHLLMYDLFVQAAGPSELPPLWLDEGVATVLETADIGLARLAAASPNPGRLGALRQLIRSNRCPDPLSVVGLPPAATLSPDQYAVAWGLVDALPREPAAGSNEPPPERLRRYLEACRAGASPKDAFCTIFTGGAAGYDAWRRAWMRSTLGD